MNGWEKQFWSLLSPETTQLLRAELKLYDCDCCGKPRVCSRFWAYGIETIACDECRGIDGDDWTEEQLP